MSSRAQAPEEFADWKFIEAWVDSTYRLPYFLMLVADRSGVFRVFDPAKNYEVVFETSNYEDARLFLIEDEYERVKGRIEDEENDDVAA